MKKTRRYYTSGTALSSQAQRRRIHNAKNNGAKLLFSKNHARVSISKKTR